MKLIRMRAMTARRLDKAVLRCQPMTQEQAWAALSQNFPMSDRQLANNERAESASKKYRKAK